MKSIIPLVLITLWFSCSSKDGKLKDYPITSAELSMVELTDSFWLPAIKLIQNTTISHSLQKCYDEGRLDNFLIAGGKLNGKTKGKMPFDDTDIYKIIEGASYSLISNPNPALEKTLDSIIEIIKVGQEPDGYITTWFTINPQEPPANWVKPSKERWENEISSHELYNSGHLFEAAAAHYSATKKRNFLDIALKNADLLADNFGPGKKIIVPGHQIVETGLIKLYRITHEKNYLELAKFFLDERGDSISRKLYGYYNQDHMPVIAQKEVVGHAVRGVYMYAGMTDIAAIYNDKTYLDAVNALWENMVNKKMYITGGIGSRHEGESFGADFELPNLTAYNETCAAIGNILWNQKLFLLTGQSKYYDVIERTLYNGMISGISLDGTKFFYPNPLESNGIYQFNMGSCTRQPWFDCSCCPTNLIRFIPSIPNLIYATKDDSLYVNLFIASKATLKLKKSVIEITQKTDFPWNGNILLEVNPEKESEFTIMVRIPGWLSNKPLPGNLYHYVNESNASPSIKVNGKDEREFCFNGYQVFRKKWQKGDKIEISFPMLVQEVQVNENTKDDEGQVAIEYGPFVYCAEEVDNDKSILNTFITKNTAFKIEKKTGELGTINILTCKATEKTNDGKVKDTKLTLIPYYAWSNRGVGKMKVWFDQASE